MQLKDKFRYHPYVSQYFTLEQRTFSLLPLQHICMLSTCTGSTVGFDIAITFHIFDL